MKYKQVLLAIAVVVATSGMASYAQDVCTVVIQSEDCSTQQTVIVRNGTTLRVTASPMEGYHFTQWQDGNTDNPRIVSVEADATLTASYAQDVCTVVIQSEDCSTQQTVIVRNGTTLRVTASPMAGYHFTQWQDGNTDNPRIVSVEADVTFEAQFAASEDGPDVPTSVEEAQAPVTNAPTYDVLGREVGEDYRGIVIQNGQKTLVQ